MHTGIRVESDVREKWGTNTSRNNIHGGQKMSQK